jgi:hypothetical protein
MIDSRGQTVRIGDWVRIEDGYHTGTYAEIGRVGGKAAHIHVHYKSKSGDTIFMTIRATKVVKVAQAEVMLYKLENL